MVGGIRYINDNAIKNIVLLEDFVGSGNQINKVVEIIGSKFANINFLIVPLIICPRGASRMHDWMQAKNIKVAPVLVLPDEIFVDNKNTNFDSIYHFAKKYYYLLSNESELEKHSRKPPFHYLGFKKTGGLIVIYSNTPNNSIPLIHYASDDWKPVFPRHDR